MHSSSSSTTFSPSPGEFGNVLAFCKLLLSLLFRLYWHRLKGVRISPTACKGWARAKSWTQPLKTAYFRFPLQFIGYSFIRLWEKNDIPCSRKATWPRTQCETQGSRHATQQPRFPFTGLLEKKERFVAWCFYFADLITEPVLLSMLASTSLLFTDCAEVVEDSFKEYWKVWKDWWMNFPVYPEKVVGTPDP